ncbi:SRPBCC family protein [Nocardia mexicana]|uniref:Polyketide cyclase/dehydrase/lipid transport protein n=1 Tax=Nocardia mexicana TaxID=279262 RepID=A0A370H214_9NOCA|nr:SRPBCC family protein [Nocardia mexicana]RDI50046.1 polyketide cyclase/dehydrase/lipid transport protein [Nocardia mexicana]
METITVERTIAAPIEDVFEWLSNADNYTRSSVVLRRRLVRPGADAPYGRDAVRDLTWVIGWFRERITAYDPPHGFDYFVERSIPSARHDGGGLVFTEVPGGTRVVWTTTAEVPMPFVGGLITRALARPIISYVFGKVLETADRSLSGSNTAA